MKFAVVVHRDKDNGYGVIAPDLPGVLLLEVSCRGRGVVFSGDLTK